MNDKATNYPEILIPIIRKVMPTMIASELCSQPMTGPSLSLPLELSEGFYDDGLKYYSVRLPVDSIFSMRTRYSGQVSEYDLIQNWCTKTFGESTENLNTSSWFYSAGKYYFNDEANRTMFLLRWGN